jgi:hypothetical protein
MAAGREYILICMALEVNMIRRTTCTACTSRNKGPAGHETLGQMSVQVEQREKMEVTVPDQEMKRP